MNLSSFGTIVKTYPPRGRFHQFRFDGNRPFHCSRCGRDKVSKLITVCEDNEKILCNGCYGLLLSREGK